MELIMLVSNISNPSFSSHFIRIFHGSSDMQISNESYFHFTEELTDNIHIFILIILMYFITLKLVCIVK